ncbi:hypothetical protein C6P61_11665 [Malikia spinosa]|jgi:hypothetical protein|uniref:Uncharacterized protein n=1 Tax=Malikia spinosa TaxID=86180 RepID=A0A2S9KD64_9BURK|nr:hypothetical protein [Malikia spinosa]PRD68364.1 hypothetical protein C6P61_11665 [Malikia spinosa]
MSELSETLGHLLCEITRARMAADRESVRIARQYAEDDGGLLRHFPVPRMRMPQLELTLPVVVSHIPQGYVAKVAPDMLVSALSANLKEALKGLAIHVSTTEIRKIVRADANLSQGLVSDQLPTLLTEQLHDHTRRLVERQLAKAAAGNGEAVPASQSAERFKEIAAIIRTQVNRTLDALPQRPVGISVDARTQQVKEVNQGGSFCLSLKLNVTEEGLDMVFEDSEPGQDKLPALSRLVPE